MLISCTSHTKIVPINHSLQAEDDKVEVWALENGKSHSLGKGTSHWRFAIHPFSSQVEVILKKKGCLDVRHRLRTKTSLMKSILGGIMIGAGFALAAYKTRDNYNSEQDFIEDNDRKISSINILGGLIATAGFIPAIYDKDYDQVHTYDYHCIKTQE